MCAQRSLHPYHQYAVLRARRRPTKGPLVRPTAVALCTPTASQQPRKVVRNHRTSPWQTAAALHAPGQRGGFGPPPALGATALGAQPGGLSRSSSHAGLPGCEGRCRDAGQVSSPARPPQRAGCCGHWSAAGPGAGAACRMRCAGAVQLRLMLQDGPCSPG